MVMFYALRVCLGCVHMKNGRVIAYASRKLKRHEENYPIHDFEMVVVILLLKYGGIIYTVKLVTNILTIRA